MLTGDKMKTSRRAQIQTMETIAVLFIFFILIGLGLIFYGSYQKGKLNIKLVEIQSSKSIRLAQTVLNLPELASTRKGVSGSYVIDELKLDSLKFVIDNNQELRYGLYQQKFGNSKIIVRKIYPINQEWEIYENPIEEIKSQYSFFIPISIYEPLNLPSGTYSYGLLEVTYYG